jgi:hypothetical protein
MHVVKKLTGARRGHHDLFSKDTRVKDNNALCVLNSLYMYRHEDMIVILSKLYFTTINRGIVSCILTLLFLAKANRIAMFMKLYFFELHIVISSNRRYIYNLLLSNKNRGD